MSQDLDAALGLVGPGQEDARRELRESQSFAEQQNPQEVAKRLHLARERGVPVGAVDPEEAKAQPSAWEDLASTSPGLARLLSDPVLGAALRDDVPTLSVQEQLFANWKDMAWGSKEAWVRQTKLIELAELNRKEMDGALLPADRQRMALLEKETEKPLAEFGALSGLIPAAAEQLPNWLLPMSKKVPKRVLQGGAIGGGAALLVGFVAGAPVTIPALGAAILGGSRAGYLVGTVEAAGELEEGLAFAEYKKLPGVTFEDAKLAARIVKYVNGGLEALGMESVLKVLPWAGRLTGGMAREGIRKLLTAPTKKAAVARILGRLASGAVGEAVTEALQELDTIGMGELVAKGDLGPGAQMRERIMAAAKMGAYASIGLGAVAAMPGVLHERAAVKRATQSQQFWNGLAETSKALKAKEALTSELKEHVTSLQQQYGTFETVNVPGEKLREVFKLNQLAEEDVAARMPEVARQLDTGVDEVAIPVEDFALHIAGLNGFDSLQADLRVGDGLTIREAEQARKDAAGVLKEMQKPVPEGVQPTPERKVFEDVKRKRMVLGTPESQAVQEATLWASFASSRASRGVAEDAWVYHQKQRLDISHEDISAELARVEEELAKNPGDENLKRQVKALFIAKDFTSLEQANPEEVQVEATGGTSSGLPLYKFSVPESPLHLIAKVDFEKRRVEALSFEPLSFAYGTPEAAENRAKFGGKGVATAIYIRALQFAQRNKMEYASDAILLPASVAMYARLRRIGIPLRDLSAGFGEGAEAYDISRKALSKIPLERLWAQYQARFGESGRTLFQDQQELDDEKRVEPFFSAVERALKAAKQEKGDPKSWWSVISKAPGVKKEELEFIGLKEWLDAIDSAAKSKNLGEMRKLLLPYEPEDKKDLPQDKLSSTINRATVGNFLKLHRVTVTEHMMGKKWTSGAGHERTELSEEEVTELINELNEMSGIYVNQHSNGRFSVSATIRKDDETDDFDAIVSYVAEREGGGRRYREWVEAGRWLNRMTPYDITDEDIEVWLEANEEPDAEDFENKEEFNAAHDEWESARNRAYRDAWASAADEYAELFNDFGSNYGASVTVNREDVTFSGYTEEEIETEDHDEIHDYLSEVDSSRTANRFTEIMERLGDAGLLRGQSGQASVVPPWKQYQLGEGNLATEGSYGTLVITNPDPADKFTHTSHYPQRGLIAHIRFAEHVIDDKKVFFVEEIQSDRFQKAESVVAKAKTALKEAEEHGGAAARAKHIIAAGGLVSAATVKKRIVREEGFWTDPATGLSSTEADIDDASEKLAASAIQHNALVPDAPLRTAWFDALLRRAVFEAARHGYTEFGWISGDATAERWSSAVLQATDHVTLKKEGEFFLLTALKSGNEVKSVKLKSTAELQDYVGAQAATKLLAKFKASGDTFGEVWGNDLQIGAVAFRRSLDQVAVSVVKQLTGVTAEKVMHPGLKDEWKAGPQDSDLATLDIDKDINALTPDLVTAIRKMSLAARLAELKGEASFYGKVKYRGHFKDYDVPVYAIPLMKEMDEEAERLRALRVESEWNTNFPFVSESEMDKTELRFASKISELRRSMEWVQDFDPEDTPPSLFTHRLRLLQKAHEAMTRKAPNPEEAMAALGLKEFPTRGELATAEEELMLDKGDLAYHFKIETDKSEPPEHVKIWRASIPQEKMAEIASTGVNLYQHSAVGVRGSISFSQERDWFRITLSGKANLSTFLHESGHAFLEMMRRDAEAGHAQTAADLAVLDQWLGRAPGADYTTEQLEQFARGFEAYLREGKAPSSKLEAAFLAFESWLKFVYRTLRGLDVELTDEVRGVMDRMLASDEEIQKQAENAAALPTLGPANMKPEEFQAYKGRWEKAITEAKAKLRQDAIREMQRALGEEADQLRDDAREHVQGRPAQLLRKFLTTGEGPEELKGKLDEDAVKALYPQDRKLKKMTQKNGLNPEQVAPFFGYSSASQMLAELAAEPSESAAVKAEFERRMTERYPGFGITPDWMERTALDKLHSEEVGLALLAELEAIGKHISVGAPKSALAALKEAAKRAITDMTVMELTPGRFIRAEEDASKQAKKAYAAKDFAEAYNQKRRQLWSREMWKLVSKAQDEMAEARDFLREHLGVARRKKLGRAGPDYLNTVDAILAGVDLAPRTQKDLQRRGNYLAYLTRLREEGEPVSIPDDLALKNWKQLSVSEARAIRDAVSHLSAMADRKNKIRIGLELRDYKRTVAEAAAHIEAQAGVNFKHKPGTPSWWEKRKKWFQMANAHLKKMEFVSRELDGGTTAGFIHSLLFQPLVDAQHAKAELSKSVLEQLKEPFRGMTLKERLRYDQRVSFLGHELLLRDVLAVALNMGNEGNKERLLRGFRWSEEAVLLRLTELLNEKDIQLVEHIWTTIDSLWPHIKALAERTTGLAPERVEASPFKLGERTLRGGYYPIVKDPEASTLGLRTAERKTGDVWENNFMAPFIESGFLKARGRDMSPLLLSLDVVPSHINEVIHYLTHYEAVRAVDRLTQNSELKEAIVGAVGNEVWKQFRPWLQAIAADGNIHQNTGPIESALRHLRFGSSVMMLGGKVTTAMMQTLGLFNTVKEVGVTHTVNGMLRFFKQAGSGNPFSEVEALSPELRDLDKMTDRDISQYMERLSSAFSEYGFLKYKLAHFSLMGMMLVQKGVNAITWYAAHEKALEDGHPNPERFAEATVRMSQTGGGIVNTAAIQRVSEGARIFVVMYTYFSVLYNQLAEKNYSETAPGKVGEFAAKWFWLVTAPVLVDAALRGKEPDRKRDEESWLKFLLLEQLLYASRTLPGVGLAAEGYLNEREARVAPWLSAVVKGAVVLGKVDDGLKERERKQLLVETLGTLTHTPTLGAWNAWKYVESFSTGKAEEPVRNLLFRSPSQFK